MKASSFLRSFFFFLKCFFLKYHTKWNLSAFPCSARRVVPPIPTLFFLLWFPLFLYQPLIQVLLIHPNFSVRLMPSPEKLVSGFEQMVNSKWQSYWNKLWNILRKEILVAMHFKSYYITNKTKKVFIYEKKISKIFQFDSVKKNFFTLAQKIWHIFHDTPSWKTRYFILEQSLHLCYQQSIECLGNV